jgi:hypothetical protein
MRSMCRYSPYGCLEKVNHDQRSLHEDICTFVPVECRVGLSDNVVKCGWRGKKSDLLKHVTLSHGHSFVGFEETIRDLLIRDLIK